MQISKVGMTICVYVALDTCACDAITNHTVYHTFAFFKEKDSRHSVVAAPFTRFLEPSSWAAIRCWLNIRGLSRHVHMLVNKENKIEISASGGFSRSRFTHIWIISGPSSYGCAPNL